MDILREKYVDRIIEEVYIPTPPPRRNALAWSPPLCTFGKKGVLERGDRSFLRPGESCLSPHGPSQTVKIFLPKAKVLL